jgi:hypothetical protein
MSVSLTRLLLVALFALLLGQEACAWGNPGHRITGLIANSQLTASTRAQLKVLLGSDDLSLQTNWMDDERESLEKQRPGTSRWHYENRTICGTFVRDCPRGDCVTEQIERHRQVLADTTASKIDRAKAVRVLAHLIGDLHQPLHLADNADRGGNDSYVELPGERYARRLHEAWDVSFVKMNMRRKSEAKFAADLAESQSRQRTGWEQGTVQDWAQETYLLGKRYAYEALPGFACAAPATRSTNAINNATGKIRGPIVLSPEYIASARKTVDTQLAAAGVRLAHVLNLALGAR